MYSIGILSTRLHKIRKGNVVETIETIVFSKVVIKDMALLSIYGDGIPCASMSEGRDRSKTT